MLPREQQANEPFPWPLTTACAALLKRIADEEAKAGSSARDQHCPRSCRTMTRADVTKVALWKKAVRNALRLLLRADHPQSCANAPVC